MKSKTAVLKAFKALTALFAVCFMLLTIPLPLPAKAANTLTSTLDIAAINQNTSGPGYDWQNIDRILTLNNLNIDTSDPFGLTLPADTTVILKGKNYIKASETAIRCVTSATFEGSGSLTIVSGNTGIICVSTLQSDILRFRSGKLDITSPNYGIYSENAIISFAGASVKVNSDSFAVRGKNIQMTSGNLDITGKISASSDLTITGVNLTASASESVLSAGYSMNISGVKLSAGSAPDMLTEADKYNGENAVKFISTVKNFKSSILFGENVPSWVDGIAFAFLILIAAALIAVPLYFKHLKTKKLLAEYAKLKSERDKRTGTKKKSKVTKK